MQCITSFDQVEIYRGFGWKKKFKAPTEHCFALKHPKLQKKSKDIRYFCCEDEYTLKKWLTGMRIAKVCWKEFPSQRWNFRVSY